MKRAPRRALWLLLACWALYAAPAHAEYRYRVVVLSVVGEQDPITIELLARLRGELTADGLEVLLVPAHEGTDVRDEVESSARELSPSAVIGVRYVAGSTPGQLTAEVWISDRLSNRTLVQRAALDSGNSAQAAWLAVQVSELLKARLALLWVEPAPVKSSPQVVAPAPCPAPTTPSPPANPRWLLGVGLGAIQQIASSPLAWVPLLELGGEPFASRWAAFGVRASAGWTPSDSVIRRGNARARVSQGWGLAQGFMRFVPHGLVQPTISLGAGAYSVRIEGEAQAPDAARSERTWSPAASLGLGLWLVPMPGLAFALEGQALAASTTVVSLKGSHAASFGLPAAIVSASWIGRY